MKKSLKSIIVLFCLAIVFRGVVHAQTATVRVNSDVTYQKITGFGGFVCSGTFAYDHMSTTEIKRLWGKDSQAGYNIMRLYIPIGKDSWSQSLETAKLAKSLGITVFASPWSMPAEWKTNDNIAAIYTDEDGVKLVGHLREEYYEDYANYLNDYVTYLRDNGVELDAISIQNEPDMESTYAGCIWSPAQIATFLKRYGNLIDCKIIAPESVGITENYANAMEDDSVSAELDIFAGHQYSYLQDCFDELQAKGKEVWMTEFLINWNENENTSRNFDWEKDAFSFANKLNTAMLANVNAWIHYASKRFYGLMGDGTFGTTNGVMTKRGNILSHYAKYTIGTTRIGATWNDDLDSLKGSSYLSVTGDSVILMVINPSNDVYSLTVDLPFYTKSGTNIETSKSADMLNSKITLNEETCRATVNINPSSFTTLIFEKSRDREASQMTGEAVHYNKIENQVVTNTNFGTGNLLSGTTKTFDHSNFLISSNTNASKGFIALNDRYNALVFHVESITSAMNYTSANTTLYYINNAGGVSSHNYGEVNFDQNGNYDWILDISPAVLTDGCSGILGISNSNWSSVLTITFGDVYFLIGKEKAFKFTGDYSKSDSDLIDCMGNSSMTSIDFTETSAISGDQDWNASFTNPNCLYYVSSDVMNNHANIIPGTSCNELILTSEGGDFNVPFDFTATTASYSRTFSHFGLMMLPFEATIPAEARGYRMQASSTKVNCTLITNNIIPANTPVLIAGEGTLTFTGTGEVTTPKALTVDGMNGVYISIGAPVGSYCFNINGGIAAFYQVSNNQESTIIPFSAYLPSGISSASLLPLIFDDETAVKQIKGINNTDSGNNIIYDLMGRRIAYPQKGHIYIQNGKKIVY